MDKTIKTAQRRLRERDELAYINEQVAIRIGDIVDCLEETTLSKLKYNNFKGFPKTTKRQNIVDTVLLTNFIVIPYIDRNELLIKAKTRTYNNKEYDSSMLVMGVSFTDSSTPKAVGIALGDGGVAYINPLAYTKNDVKVTCNCLDFAWRFSYTNAADGSLLGDVPTPKYQPTGTRPPVNPMKVAGICKHLLRLVTEMERKRMFGGY